MKRIISGIVAWIVTLTVSAQSEVFVTLTSVDVNLREQPSASSKKLVYDPNYNPDEPEDMERGIFATQGKAYHCSTNEILYSPETRGEWRKVLVDFGFESKEAWVMTKFTTEVEATPIQSLEETGEGDPTYLFIRTQGAFKGWAVKREDGYGDLFIVAKKVENGVLYAWDSCCERMEYDEGNKPFSVEGDGTGIFITYSALQTKEVELYGRRDSVFDINKLTDEEMYKFLTCFDRIKKKSNEPISISYYFRREGEDKKLTRVTVPFENLSAEAKEKRRSKAAASLAEELAKAKQAKEAAQKKEIPPVVKEEKPKEEEVRDEKIYVNVDEKSEFPGGDEGLKQWLEKNLKYPALAYENGAMGRVSAEFVVSSSGSVSIVNVTRSPHPSMSKEVERGLKMLPKWKPAKIDGKPVGHIRKISVIFDPDEGVRVNVSLF